MFWEEPNFGNAKLFYTAIAILFLSPNAKPLLTAAAGGRGYCAHSEFLPTHRMSKVKDPTNPLFTNVPKRA